MSGVPGDGDLQMIRMNRHGINWFVDEGPLLRFGGCLPHALDVVLEESGDLLVARYRPQPGPS